MRVALFGGSFDPPHFGHQVAMLNALATARVERLLMVPCFRHPFDKRLSPYEHRLAMARRAAEPFGGRVEVSEVEQRLGGESRTLNTVKALLAERPGDRIVLVIGADLVAERERWYGYEELKNLVEFHVVKRDGQDVSSTEVRDRLGRGEAIDGLVAASVSDYIGDAGLYRRAG